ncbi:transcriptional regulator [Fusobacterium necrophorum BFTR-2]|nr:helix-turn-helix transcriptional regulator [Fusobacterium necrophorum]KDE68100.1 transcriptional regulator [Fusobacterium necrophorum BFTR-2]
MYKCKLRYLMADKKINTVKELIDLTGVSRPPLDKLYKEVKLETLSLDVLARICDFFNCNLSDLVEYIPDEKPNN